MRAAQLDSDLYLTLRSCLPLLRPGGTIAVVTRLVWRGGQLIDPTWSVHLATEWHGLGLIERVAALRVPLRDATPIHRRCRAEA